MLELLGGVVMLGIIGIFLYTLIRSLLDIFF